MMTFLDRLRADILRAPGLGLALGLGKFRQAGGGGGNPTSENITDESTNILTDESGNNLTSSGA